MNSKCNINRNKLFITILVCVSIFLLLVSLLGMNITKAYASISQATVVSTMNLELEPDVPAVDTPSNDSVPQLATDLISKLANTGDATTMVIIGVLALASILTACIYLTRRRLITNNNAEFGDMKDSKILKMLSICLLILTLAFGSFFYGIKAFATTDNIVSIDSKVLVSSDGTVKSANLSLVNNLKSPVKGKVITAPVELSDWTSDIEPNTIIDPGESVSGVWNPSSEKIPNSLLEKLKGGETTLKLQFETIIEYETYSIVWDENYDTGKKTEIEYTGYEIAKMLSPEPTRELCSLVEWNTKSDGSGETVNEEYLESHPVTQDITFYAIWDVAEYNITYELNGGVLPTGKTNPTTYLYGTGVAQFESPERAGYDFAGWLDAETVVNKITNTDFGNKILYARWTPRNDTKYTVEHYLQNIDDDEYTKSDTDTQELTGTTDTVTNATAKSITGFTSKQIQQQNINGDGSTVVKVYYDRKIFTVKFDPDGKTATVPSDRNIRYQGKVEKPAEIQIPGYKNVEWCTRTDNEETMFDFDNTKITKDTTLFALWAPRNDTPYTVEHLFQNTDNDEYTKNDEMTENLQGTTGRTTNATAKTITGFTAQSITQKHISADGSTVVEIKYARNIYSVTFNLNGKTGSAPETQNVKYEGKATAPDSPSATGYTFGGWYTTSDCTGNAFDFTATTITGDITLFAKWTASANTPYAVKHFKQNLDNDDYPSTPDETETLHGTTGENTNAQAKTYEGFTAGAITQAKITADGSTVVEIKYARNIYSVTFNLNGKTGSAPETQNVKYEGKATAPAFPSATGYTFGGWYTTSDCTGNAFDFTATTITGDITLFAKWTASANTPYAVKHFKQNLDNDDYPSTPDETETLHGTTGENTNAQAKTYEGFTAGAITQAKIAADGSTVVEIKYARNIYSVTFNLNGKTGSAPETQNVKYEGKATAPAFPSATGYTFGGWYTTSDCSGDAFDFENTQIKRTTFLYAKWTANEYMITYNLDGGQLAEGTNNPSYYTYGEGVESFNSPTKQGYDFEGWFDDATAGNKVESISDTDLGNKTLYARWTASANTPYYVYHHSQNINNDDYYVLDADELTGTTGTYTKASAKTYSGRTNKDFDQVIISPDGLTVVHIYYDRIKYEVIFDLNGKDGTAPETQTVKYEGYASVPTPPTVAGYTFGGWYTNSDCTGDVFDFTRNQIEAETHLYAKWTANGPVTVTFNAMGGEGSPFKNDGDAWFYKEDGTEFISSLSYEINLGEVLKAPYNLNFESETFTAPNFRDTDHYEFKGWFTEPEGQGKQGEIGKTVVDNDVTYYAYYEAKSYVEPSSLKSSDRNISLFNMFGIFF